MNEQIEQKNPQSKKALLIILLVVFVDLLGFGMIIPLIALYGKNFGASIIELSILGSIYSLMQFIFSPLWGSLSDRYGRRPIILLSLFGSSASYLIFALAPSVIWLLVSRGFAGLFTANISTAHAYVSDSTPDEDRAKYMGLVGAALGLGFTIGPPFGGIAAKHLGLSAPGFIASCICALNLVAAYLYLPESLSLENRRVRSISLLKLNYTSLKEAITHRTLAVFLVAGFLTTLAFSHLEQAFSLFLQIQLELTTEDSAYKAGILLLSMGVVGVVVQGGLIKMLSLKFGERKLLLFGVFVNTVSLPFFAQSSSFTSFLISGIPLAIGTALINPSVASLVSKSAPSHKLGETFGVVQGLSSLARVIGPFSGLAAFSLWSPLPFIIGAAIYAALLVYLVLRMDMKKPLNSAS